MKCNNSMGTRSKKIHSSTVVYFSNVQPILDDLVDLPKYVYNIETQNFAEWLNGLKQSLTSITIESTNGFNFQSGHKFCRRKIIGG